MNESNTSGKSKSVFPKSEKKSRKEQEEYTPEMKDRKQLHDESEGGEFLDDVVEFEEPPSPDNEENIRG
ncbi:MAG TPA: hypothetical protein VFI33_18845 [Puia sp.]|nr:hypothetical protein [Puia sp.]